MTFIPKPQMDKLERDALTRPHSPLERFDPDFPVVMRCEKCGKRAAGPRRYMREAMLEHMESVCPARHTRADEENVMRIYCPRQ